MNPTLTALKTNHRIQEEDPKHIEPSIGRRVKQFAFNTFTLNNDIVKYYNAGICILVFGTWYFSSSIQSTEYLADVAIHSLQAAVKPDSPKALKIAALAANITRLISIYHYGSLGTSMIPSRLNYVDIVNHSLNLVATTGSLITNEKEK